MKGRSTLERKMLSYFGLIAAASLLITFEFVWAIKHAVPDRNAVELSEAVASGKTVSVESKMQVLENKAYLMCLVQTTVTLIVLIMFIRRITSPLQQMAEEARLISDGDLSRTIKVRTSDEIGMIGDTINGLTSNIQEIVALAMYTESDIRPPLKELQARLANDTAALESLNRIEVALDNFHEIAQGFELLQPPTTQE